MRLIDADALLNALGISEGGECDKCKFQKDGIFCKRDADFAVACTAICDASTIEERKTGKWISLDDFRGKYNDYGYKCSECGEHSDYEENFCPNCGADNRGKGC